MKQAEESDEVKRTPRTNPPDTGRKQRGDALQDWGQFLTAMTLALVRISGMVAFAPFFSSAALPARSKAAFVFVLSFLLAPLVAGVPRAHTELEFSTLLSEVAVGLVYGLVLTLLNEMLMFAGQIAGMQFSFSLVNLLDPASQIQTPLLGELFQLMGTLVILAAGLDRILLASLVRSFHAVPLGTFVFTQPSALAIVHAAGGIFLAALELAAPVLAATLLVEIVVSLLGKLSPQLPVMSLTVPIKTLTGFAVLIGSLALWPRFIEARFSNLLDLAEHLLAGSAVRG
ncbi:MAG: flagellar biosynthetic protein FliR [Terracidiphilus sp.]|nr:flagellar biosynthetic protein FliR [Terracidiphilus sp.]